ncbi:acyl-CoA dehydrogenase [Salipiger pacificus]|uniref:Acyl-CoA dehydrogenase n=2 Tax=Salipiger mangrovisoli TaxID=2865933 RepID=A0ABR9X683_9RHOB|nr:acyl-CoA dehydrogenase [Salipiger mangrovisoli]MBE9639105.1 acyl-CoA dehydrogenase [Salipiger mangrovisoli]
MPEYTAPVADLLFVLCDVLQIDRGDFDSLDRTACAAILTEVARLAEARLAPLNRTGDLQGCRLENGVVRSPEGFPEAFAEVCAGGWYGLDCAPEHGGQGLPHMLHCAVGEILSAANMAFHIHAGLTHGAYGAIAAHGSEAQKALYLPKLANCRWTGTMNLTEPQCGTDLGLIRTRAEAIPDSAGRFRLYGTKIFISAGEHELAENILHLVLARLPFAPEGVRGLSLFIAPKRLPAADGSPGARNALRAARIEAKMGLHGNATCEMVYDGAEAELLGAPHQGLAAMFTMMNEERISVGLQGYAQADRALQGALAFARSRTQGRAPGAPARPDAAADPILVHPDVRRMLLDIRGFTEGARALTLWGAQLVDSARAGDAAAAARLSLVTPVIKGFLSDKGVDCCLAAQQVLGGAGYIEEMGLSQILRDARVTTIYEGTNGVQALDLVARKLGANGGAAMLALLDEMNRLANEPDATEALDEIFLAPLRRALEDLQSALLRLQAFGAGDPEAALSGASDFLHLFGHVCLGYMWARMARAAASLPEPARRAKLDAGRHYMSRQLPATALHLARIEAGAVAALPLDAGAAE